MAEYTGYEYTGYEYKDYKIKFLSRGWSFLLPVFYKKKKGWFITRNRKVFEGYPVKRWRIEQFHPEELERLLDEQRSRRLRYIEAWNEDSDE
jgi:hypothetical protein